MLFLGLRLLTPLDGGSRFDPFCPSVRVARNLRAALAHEKIKISA